MMVYSTLAVTLAVLGAGIVGLVLLLGAISRRPTHRCRKCGQVHDRDARFCPRCGSEMHGSNQSS